MSEPPKGLPEPVESKSESGKTALDKVRVCPKCQEPTRIVSDSGGVRAYCNKCKECYGVSSTPRVREVPRAQPRGLHKETIVEPNWDMAFELDGEVDDKIGPPRS